MINRHHEFWWTLDHRSHCLVPVKQRHSVSNHLHALSINHNHAFVSNDLPGGLLCSLSHWNGGRPNAEGARLAGTNRIRDFLWGSSQADVDVLETDGCHGRSVAVRLLHSWRRLAWRIADGCELDGNVAAVVGIGDHCRFRSVSVHPRRFGWTCHAAGQGTDVGLCSRVAVRASSLNAIWN